MKAKQNAGLQSERTVTGKRPKVYWITGLSGAGKTTIGCLWHEKLKSVGETVVFLDGDELRQVFDGHLGYTSEECRMVAMNYAILSGQGRLSLLYGFSV